MIRTTFRSVILVISRNWRVGHSKKSGIIDLMTEQLIMDTQEFVLDVTLWDLYLELVCVTSMIVFLQATGSSVVTDESSHTSDGFVGYARSPISSI